MFEVKTLHSWWFKRDIREKLEPICQHKYIVSRGSHKHAPGNKNTNVCSWNQENLEFVGQICAEVWTYHHWMIGCMQMHRCANARLLFFNAKKVLVQLLLHRHLRSVGFWAGYNECIFKHKWTEMVYKPSTKHKTNSVFHQEVALTRSLQCHNTGRSCSDIHVIWYGPPRGGGPYCPPKLTCIMNWKEQYSKKLV